MKLLLYLLLLFSIAARSQNDFEEGLKFSPEVSLAFINQTFLGDNYLSKGHKKPTFGGVLKLNMLSYNHFFLGFEFEKNISKVDDFSIGGNIDKTKMNSFRVLLSYRIAASSKFIFDPQIKYGIVELKQENGSKSYGIQDGNTIGIGCDAIYKYSKVLSIFTNIGYNYYSFNVNTTPEFENYFNHSHSLNISIGLKIN
jgi:hypothetical protein